MLWRKALRIAADFPSLELLTNIIPLSSFDPQSELRYVSNSSAFSSGDPVLIEVSPVRMCAYQFRRTAAVEMQ